MLFLAILAVTIVFLFCKYISQRPKNFPPGPPHYPLIGGALSMPSGDIHLTQQEWLAKYGDALKKPEFQGRPQTSDFTATSFGKSLGIGSSMGAQWQVSRKFTIKILKGVKNMEDILQLEMDELIGGIKSGEAYQMNDLFKESTVNFIWTILSGMRCTVADQRIKTLLDNLTEAFRSGRMGSRLETLLNAVPVLSFLDENRMLQKKAFEALQNFFRESIHEHRATLDPDHPRDLYDAYLIEQKNAQETGIDVDLWSEENLIILSSDIFSASYETLNSSMSFMVLYMILYPDVQTKLQQELDKHLGTRRPTLEDRHHLHYVQAVISEVFRINAVAPITIPHCALENTTFHDYFIPKDTTIFISLWSLLHDEKAFEEPSKFKPERFLGPDGKFDKKNPNFINFGAGRRTCAGDFIAVNVMFLYVSTLFQKYSVHRDPNNPDLQTKAMAGFTTSPQPYTAIIRERY
ncbi:hypothetical protein M8J76_012369 [Diaphorina citri]|nr:hypothetical protein M8J76_012369 [Diaphorina citri]